MSDQRHRFRIAAGAAARALFVLFLLCLAAAWLGPLAVRAAEAPTRLVGHGGPIKSVYINPDGDLWLSAGFDYSIIRWEIDGETARLGHRFLDHDGGVNDIAATPDGKLAVSASDDGTVGVFDLATNRLVKRLTGHMAKVVDVAVSADGKIAASAGWDRTARLWDLEKLAPLAVLDGHRGNVNSVSFSPDGTRLYTAGYDGTIRSWHAADGTPQGTVYRYGGPLNVIRLVPGGKHALFGGIGNAGSGFIGVVDLATGELAKILQPFSRPVLAANVWPKHHLAAAAGSDGIVRVWDLDTWELKYEHENPYGPVWSLAISGDGKKIYYSGLDDFVVGWQIKPLEAFESAVGVYPRRFQVTENMDPGEMQFAQRCSVCHTLSPQDGNRAGPSLYRLFGREAGSLPGYPYSKALRDSTIVWNEKSIAQLFDDGPDQVTPGSKMPLQRLKSVEDRDALIAYLKRATGDGGGAITGQSGTDASQPGETSGDR
jgi:cytochrome c